MIYFSGVIKSLQENSGIKKLPGLKPAVCK
ncbi:hypothetical protein X794_00570 [Dehalococcoides mccartyi CG5]|jgi:hypothetical protein|nr:hypothetical protein X794_00570 [Dehalococcoides mccartyi CG5]